MASKHQVYGHRSLHEVVLTFSLDRVDLGGGWFHVPAEKDDLEPYITTNVQVEVLSLRPRRLTCFHTSNDVLGKLSSRNRIVVNAFLAYSRGQLALAPCTDCHRSHEHHERHDVSRLRPSPDLLGLRLCLLRCTPPCCRMLIAYHPHRVPRQDVGEDPSPNRRCRHAVPEMAGTWTSAVPAVSSYHLETRPEFGSRSCPRLGTALATTSICAPS